MRLSVWRGGCARRFLERASSVLAMLAGRFEPFALSLVFPRCVSLMQADTLMLTGLGDMGPHGLFDECREIAFLSATLIDQE